MSIFFGSLFFVFGLSVGSFLNVVLLRFNTGSFWKKSASFCLSCTRELRSLDNIPLLGYLIRKGRCFHCGSKFSAEYVFVEMVTALLFLASYLLYGFTLEAFLMAALFSCLVLISVYDYKHLIVPDHFSIPWNVFAFLTIFVTGNRFVLDPSAFVSHTVAGVVAFGFFTFLFLVTKGRGVGFADGVIALGIGFVLGWPLTMTALVLAFWIGAFVAVGQMALSRLQAKGVLGTTHLFTQRKALTMKSEIPFGPYLAIGFLITLLTHVSLF